MNISLTNYLQKAEDLAKVLKTVMDFKEVVFLANKRLFKEEGGQIVLETNIEVTINSLLKEHVQPKNFSLVNGKKDDLIQIFGAGILGSSITVLPHLLYFSRDKLSIKKINPDKNPLAGSILGMELTVFQSLPEYEAMWLNNYAVNNVGSHHPDYILCLQWNERSVTNHTGRS